MGPIQPVLWPPIAGLNMPADFDGQFAPDDAYAHQSVV
jgi:hypothetical protein